MHGEGRSGRNHHRRVRAGAYPRTGNGSPGMSNWQLYYWHDRMCRALDGGGKRAAWARKVLKLFLAEPLPMGWQAVPVTGHPLDEAYVAKVGEDKKKEGEDRPQRTEHGRWVRGGLYVRITSYVNADDRLIHELRYGGLADDLGEHDECE